MCNFLTASDSIIKVKIMISVRQALNIAGRESGKAAQMLPNRSMNNLAKSTLLIWSVTIIWQKVRC
jgi:hypothetical protein